MHEPMSNPVVRAAEPRALRILAKSVFRELKTTGYSRSDIVAFATEMLSLVSSDIRDGDFSSSGEPTDD
ncbi:MAG: hypothetical protein R3B82_14225 [Sandaracinaceae bacterium]